MVVGDEAGADEGTSAAEEVNEDAEELREVEACKARRLKTAEYKTLYIIHYSFINIEASTDIH